MERDAEVEIIRVACDVDILVVGGFSGIGRVGLEEWELRPNRRTTIDDDP
jgi:hypothetical protein